MSKLDKIEKLKEKQRKKLEKLENRKEVKKVKGVMSEFKKFAMKGNVIDMATGVIIGTAFTKIVNSLVSEIISPLLSTITGKVNYNNMFIVLGEGKFNTIEEATKAGAITLNYGVFLSNIIDFIIIAFTMFLFLRYTFNRRSKINEEEKVPKTKTCPYCKTEIDIKATRCPHCTSMLEETSEPEQK